MAEKRKLIADILPDYEPEIGAALWRLEDARKRTLRLLRDVSPEIIARDVKSNSVGTLLYHLALIEADWLYVEILMEPVPDQISRLLPHDARDQEGLLTRIRDQSLRELTHRLNHVRRVFLERLHGMSGEDFHRARSLPDYDVTPAWVLHHLAQHEAEHRAELGSLIATLLKESDRENSSSGQNEGV